MYATESAVFIGSPTKLSETRTVCRLFFILPSELLYRIVTSFIPPLSSRYRRVHVDLIGPLFALIILLALTVHGSANKLHQFSIPPSESILMYGVIMPVFSFVLSRCGGSKINFLEIASLVGYSLYGNILTLLFSYLCFQGLSNLFFFFCLVNIAGLSTLRMVLIILTTIPIPACRLLVCSLISITNLLFLIFLHFAYMHQTYKY